HRELVEPGVVGDRLEVANPGLEREIRHIPIRQAMTAFVETYDRRNPPELGHEVSPHRAFPIELQMAEPAGRDQQRWPVAMYRVGDPNPVRRSTKSDLLGCGPLAIPRRHPVMLTRDDRTPAFLMADGGPAAVVGCGFLDAVDRHDRCDREAPRRQRLVPLSAHV